MTGRPDPLIGAALEADAGPQFSSYGNTNLDELVGGAQIDPAVFGLTSYFTQTAPVGRVSRAEAMQVAAVKRARDLVCGSLGTLPLETVKPDLSVDPRSWLNQPERDVPRSVTMTRTIEDLFFEGIAWWRISGFNRDLYPSEIVRLDPRTVNVLPTGTVEVTSDGHSGLSKEWPTDSELIRLDSSTDGLLISGARAIRASLALDAAALRHADGAPPIDYFTPLDGIDPDDTEVTTFLGAWQTARQTRSTGYVPGSMKYEIAGWNPEQLQMAEARQHAVLEIARAAGVDPEDLGVSTTSRTYQNSYDRRSAFLQQTLGMYRAAIEDRLSMGDVTPRGTVVRFNADGFLRSDPLTRYQAAAAGIAVGAVTREEVRADEGRPALAAANAAPVPDETPVEVPA